MRFLTRSLAALTLLSLPNALLADAPGVEYFVIKTQRLLALANTSEQIDQVPSVKLEELSEAFGTVVNAQNTHATFEHKSVRVHLSIKAPVALPGASIDVFNYSIAAGKPGDWSILSVQGTARRNGNSFIDSKWQSYPLVVIIRQIDLKH